MVLPLLRHPPYNDSSLLTHWICFMVALPETSQLFYNIGVFLLTNFDMLSPHFGLPWQQAFIVISGNLVATKSMINNYTLLFHLPLPHSRSLLTLPLTLFLLPSLPQHACPMHISFSFNCSRIRPSAKIVTLLLISILLLLVQRQHSLYSTHAPGIHCF